ncbi:histidinol phosphate aminotransferase apoenzyme [Geosporobacter subterraneus DSM 17957]|uniref:Histidinol phosphate aminotransferase apoenzyme n=1 Tax=Geosporobacter subterraneus DSM 17957 TaxID=1121919 RepID=A0A1M6FK25_9FIRM|nr:histidinol-phosphate transaminase [Geosporobacter subterraneus]SHI98016.1 histidinol phosphate aminotransferase apoenzyme [Geosporobacter subterraneus DSM 17957]
MDIQSIPNLLNIKEYPESEIKRILNKELIIKLSNNENVYGPSPKALEVIKEAVENLQFYPDPQAASLKRKLCSLWDIEKEQILIGNGADEVIDLILRGLLQKGDEVIIPTPTYDNYAIGVERCQGICRFLDMPMGNFDLVEIQKSITNQTRMIILCNPNNPTGAFISGLALEQFIESLPEHVILLLDEAYAEYEYAHVSGIRYISKKNILAVRTFSKIYGLAACRIGYAVGKSEIIQKLDDVRLLFNTNTLGLIAAEASLDDPIHIGKIKYSNQKSKALMVRQLEKQGISYYNSSGNFIMINTGVNSVEMYRRLLERGIVVKPILHEKYQTCIRVTLGTDEMNNYFLDTLFGILYK